MTHRPDPCQATQATPPPDPITARAHALQQHYFHQMTLENTPASFMNPEAGDEPMSAGGASGRAEDALADHVRAHPEHFAGTRFAIYLPGQPAITEGSREPDLAYHDEPDLDADAEPPF